MNRREFYGAALLLATARHASATDATGKDSRELMQRAAYAAQLREELAALRMEVDRCEQEGVIERAEGIRKALAAMNEAGRKS